ncbi:MAG: proline--tRNA ligase [Nanoarchaeota archaeon]|mgnify:CR=1 FL=1
MKKEEKLKKVEEKDTKGLTVKKNENFSEWYTQVVQKAELVDYAPIRGFMVVRPRAYAIWQALQNQFNKVLQEKHVENAYFPLLIPESFFKREAEHAKGFAPELAYLEGKDEGERLAIRPTSETIIYDSYAKWIRSHRDLPLRINQWCNVLRWEVKQCKPFLRTREFLWQEGHCVFADEKGAEDNMMEMIQSYKELVEEFLAIPVLLGVKSEAEKFAGAKKTTTIEALMPDGKALQCGTSHNLGQGFAKTFGIRFKGSDEKEHVPWQTSWGFSTRLIGAVAMVHGDDKGLVIPPKVARNKVVIVPIVFDENKKQILAKAQEISHKLADFGAFVDDRELSPGRKYSEWELKGVPLRIEIGPKDLEKKQVTLVRRDTGKKESVSEKDIDKTLEKMLDVMQKDLFEKAKEFLHSRIDSAKNISELKKKIEEGKMVKAYAVNELSVEEAIKNSTGGATSRIIEESAKEGVCIQTGKKTKTVMLFAKAY